MDNGEFEAKAVDSALTLGWCAETLCGQCTRMEAGLGPVTLRCTAHNHAYPGAVQSIVN